MDWCFFKGDADGNYTASYVEGGVRQEFAFIQWEGKNYLAQTTYDYDKKSYDGIWLTSYENGTVKDSLWLHMVAAKGEEACHKEISYLAAEDYRSLQEFPLQYSEENPYLKVETIEGQDQPEGTAEIYNASQEEYRWQSDLDNDGEPENYEKNIWYPSNYWAVSHLSFYIKNAEEKGTLEENLNEIFSEEEGCALFLWVDETAFGNVTYLLFEDGLYDFHINGYLGSEECFEKLLRVDFRFDLDVQVEREAYRITGKG